MCSKVLKVSSQYHTTPLTVKEPSRHAPSPDLNQVDCPDTITVSDAQLQSSTMALTVRQKTAPLNNRAKNFKHVTNLTVPDAVQSPGPELDLRYPNLAAVQTALANIASEWMPPQRDRTVPTNEEERQAWVIRVKAAFRNSENMHGKRGFKAWLEKADINEVYSEEAIEYISHHIIVSQSELYDAEHSNTLIIQDIATKLHINGPSSLHIWKPETLADIKKTSYYTFEHRMENVLKLISYWKTRCEDMMQNNGFEEIVAMPFKKMVDAVNNADMNKSRQNILEMGRKVASPQAKSSDVGSAGVTETQNEVTVQPPIESIFKEEWRQTKKHTVNTKIGSGRSGDQSPTSRSNEPTTPQGEVVATPARGKKVIAILSVP